MCTLLFAYKTFSQSPLCLASNRDEFLDRPAAGFHRWLRDGEDILAPLDVQAGGTWIGVNTHGVVAAITNRFGVPPKRDRHSRGALVPRALTFTNAESALLDLEDLNAGLFNPFHLLIADRHSAGIGWSDGRRVHRAPVEPGMHVLTERSFGASFRSREDNLRHALVLADSPDALTPLLQTRPSAKAAGARIDIEEFNYGTRSSTLVRMSEDGSFRIQHAMGPPDEANYEEVTWANMPVRPAP
jgi:uncharacterized protein with NRDE domain